MSDEEKDYLSQQMARERQQKSHLIPRVLRPLPNLPAGLEVLRGIGGTVVTRYRARGNRAP